MLSAEQKVRARFLGIIVRDYEDLDIEPHRTNARDMYVKFLLNLPTKKHRTEARKCYWEAYLSDPIFPLSTQR